MPPPNSQPQIVPVARILLAGTEAVVPIYQAIRSKQEAILAAAKPYDGFGGRAFLASTEEFLRYLDLLSAEVDPGFMFDGKIYADDLETLNAIRAAMLEEFSCQTPGRLVWHTGSNDSTSDEIEVRQTAQGDYVHYRLTAPLKRVGEAGALGDMTATFWDYRDIMSSAMAGKVRQFDIKSATGQAEDYYGFMSMMPCP